MIPAAIPLVVVIASAIQQQSWAGAIAGLAIFLPIFILVALYSFTKYLTNAALITRLAFLELKGQPESLGAAQRQVSRKMWRFLLAWVLVWLIRLGVAFILMSGIAILLGVPLLLLFGLGNNLPQGDLSVPDLVILLGIVGIVLPLLILVMLVVSLWPLARFLFPDAVLAVEDNIDTLEAVGRCWRLTQNYSWRIILIISLAGIVMFPIIAIFLFISGFLQSIFLIITGTDPGGIQIQIISTLFSYVIRFLGDIFTLPFWQLIKAIIYYALRARKEGLDLQLRDRELGL